MAVAPLTLNIHMATGGEWVWSESRPFVQDWEGHGLTVREWRQSVPGEGALEASMYGVVRPKETCLVTVEHSESLEGGWEDFEADVAFKSQDTIFEPPAIGTAHFYRFRSENIPVEVKPDEREGVLIKLNKPIEADFLTDYILGEWAVRLTQIPVIGAPVPEILPPTIGFMTPLELGFTKSLTRTALGLVPRTPDQFPEYFPERPNLHGWLPDTNNQLVPVESASTELYGNYKVLMSWKISNPNARQGRWVIQRTFGDGDEYDPPYKSVIGTVDVPELSGGGTPEAVWFVADFKTQAVFGIDPPVAFFMRLWEQDADGQILGLPSNTFAFLVQPPSPEIPAGELRFTLGKIKCYETTSGPGDDDLNWKAVRVWFKPGIVECQTVASGSNEIGDPEYVKPGDVLYSHNGPSVIPNVEDVYFIYALRERDGFASSGTPDTELAILANGLRQLGSSRTEIMNRLESTHAKDYFDGPSDEIGSIWFNLRREDVERALEQGRAIRKTTMTGDSSRYTTRFYLDWLPQ